MNKARNHFLQEFENTERRQRSRVDESHVEDMEEPEDELPRLEESERTGQDADKGTTVSRKTNMEASQEHCGQEEEHKLSMMK